MSLVITFLRKYPKLIWELRSLKHQKRFINFTNPKNLYEYIANSAIHYDNKWCRLADKYEVRENVVEIIGEKYVNDLYGVYDSPDEIAIETLPKSVVLKTTNGCASNIFIKDKNAVDWGIIKRKLSKWLAYPYGEMTGQLHYSQIKPRIIAEKYLEQPHKKSLIDYKFFCINGEPLFVFVYENREANSHKFEIGAFSMEWKCLPKYLNVEMTHATHILKPVSFDEMQNIVRKLAKGFKFVRIDLYEINGRPIFGEYTFTPSIDALSYECRDELFHKLMSE